MNPLAKTLSFSSRAKGAATHRVSLRMNIHDAVSGGNDTEGGLTESAKAARREPEIAGPAMRRSRLTRRHG